MWNTSFDLKIHFIKNRPFYHFLAIPDPRHTLNSLLMNSSYETLDGHTSIICNVMWFSVIVSSCINSLMISWQHALMQNTFQINNNYNFKTLQKTLELSTLLGQSCMYMHNTDSCFSTTPYDFCMPVSYHLATRNEGSK